MKRPFLIVALLFIAGILLGEWVHPPLTILFSLSFMAVLGGVLWSRGRFWFVLALLILAGWTNMVCRTSVLSPIDLRVLLGDRTEIVSLRGTLSGSPTERIYERDEQELWCSRAFVDVEQIRFGDDWQPAYGRVSVTTSGILASNFFSKQSVEISGVISPPRPPLAPGVFDSRTYLKRLGIYYQVQTRTNDWQVVTNGVMKSMPIADRFHAWAKKTLALGLPEEDQSLRLIWTLMLDWKAPMTQEVQEPFIRAGTYHIFAVDGLRIGMISVILVFLTRAIQIPRSLGGLCFVIPAIWFYVGLTGFPASAIRAGIMMTVIIGGWSLRRPSDILNSLFAAAFIILVWDPQQLFQAGFQLSFLVVLCIILLISMLDNWFEALFKGDPFLPNQLQPWWRRWTTKPGRWGVFTVSLAAWLGSLPLSAYYFHLFNPISIIANVPVVPMTMLSVCSGLGSLLVGSWWPYGAELFNHASWFLMNWITQISQWSASLPCAFWNVSTPGLVTICLYYIVLLTFLTGWIWRSKFKRFVLTAILGLSSLWLVQFWSQSKQTNLFVLPLRGGHAVFVDSYGKSRDLLIDCGDERSFRATTKPFLAAQGINNLPKLCLTHATMRQMGGEGLIRTNFPVEDIFTSPAKGRSPGFKRFLAEFEKTTNRLHRVVAGDKIGLWTVLHPDASDHFTTADDNAVVLCGKIWDQTILLTSELSQAGQKLLIERNPDLRADILIAGLPTKDEPVCNWLLDTVQPKLLVIADTEYPAPRRASPQLRQRLSQRNVPVIYCRDAGALTFCFEPGKWTVRTCNGEVVK